MRGAITAIAYGWLIMQMPETIIGTAIGTAIFPTLSEFVSRDDRVGVAVNPATSVDHSCSVDRADHNRLVDSGATRRASLFLKGGLSRRRERLWLSRRRKCFCWGCWGIRC